MSARFYRRGNKMKSLTSSKPTVFVSSTCYDLGQVRNDLKLFIEDGFNFSAALSEFDSFPISPDKDTIENCLGVVRNYADIFVLIIGGKYGYETDSGKSITNLEYLEAVKKGIPIYVFVQGNVLNSLQLWKDNPDGNFSSVVATNKVFGFVDQIRSKDKVWMYSFAYAQEIIHTLKNQWAYLISDSLTLRRQYTSKQLSEHLLSLSGEPLRLVIEQPADWHFLLIGELLKDGLEKHKRLKENYTFGVSHGKCITFSDVSTLVDWVQSKTQDLSICTDNLGKLFEVVIQDALNKEGVPANPETLVFAVDNIMDVYREILEWSLEFDRVVAEPEFQRLITGTRLFSKQLIKDIENYVSYYNETLKEGLRRAATRREDEPMIYIELSLTLSELDNKEFEAALDEIRNKYLR